MASEEKKPLTREQFLRAGAAAVVGGATAMSMGTASGQGSGRKLRIGVVGGGFGTSFYWHKHPNCIVQAVSDLLPERREALRQVFQCDNVYPSLEELIKDRQVEAVAVFTGAPDHVRHTVACMKAGKHVICAVPAAMTLEECNLLRDTVKRTGLTYMMAETSWYHQSVISARKWFQEGKFGTIFFTEAEYHHPGLDPLFHDAQGRRTWRYGFPPMHYPTHCTAYLVGVTGERMTRVSCTGWGDDSPFLKDNVYKNPFGSETAFFVTEKGHGFRVAVYWQVAAGGTERGQWYGDKMSFFEATPNGLGPIIRRASGQTERDSGGFVRQLPEIEAYKQTLWWQTDMLPESLRFDSGHGGSHTFLTHEFVDAVINGREPAIGIRESLNMTAPGIVAHQSALKGGEQLKVPVF